MQSEVAVAIFLLIITLLAIIVVFKPSQDVLSHLETWGIIAVSVIIVVAIAYTENTRRNRGWRRHRKFLGE